MNKMQLRLTLVMLSSIIGAAFIITSIGNKYINTDPSLTMNDAYISTIKSKPEDTYTYFKVNGSYTFNIVESKFDFDGNKMNFPCYFIYYIYITIEDWNNGHWSIIEEKYLACEFIVNITASNPSVIDSTYMNLPSKLVHGHFESEDVAIVRFKDHPDKEINYNIYYSYHIYLQDAFNEWHESFRNETYLGSFTLDRA